MSRNTTESLLYRLTLPFRRRHVYKLDGGPPWVIARTPQEARERALDDDRAPRDFTRVEQMPDDAPFTMLYSDPFDDDPVEVEECDYGCEGYHNHVTMKCRDWARYGFGIDGPVAWEFEG